MFEQFTINYQKSSPIDSREAFFLETELPFQLRVNLNSFKLSQLIVPDVLRSDLASIVKVFWQ